MGKPTLYRESHAERGFKLALLGLTLEQMAVAFGVAPRTLDDWVATHEDFADAIDNGRVIADAEVARALYVRAIGYDRECIKTFKDGDGKVAKTEHWIEHMPAESQAALKWLNNRQPERWRHQKDPLDDDGDEVMAPASVTVTIKSARIRADVE
jgi:hypothetical protein